MMISNNSEINAPHISKFFIILKTLLKKHY